MFILGIKPADISINSQNIDISGIYGDKVPLEDIKNITLENSIPKILKKTNGIDIGNRLKGNFKLKELDKGKLFIQSKTGKFIYIFTKNSYIIINYSDTEKTESLYKDLISALEHE